MKWIIHRASTSRMWVQFLLAGPLDNLKERQYNSRMYKVIENKSSTEFANLDLALEIFKPYFLE